MERSQFTFYASFRKAAAHIKKKADRCDFYDAISDYALYGVEFDPSQYPDSVAVALELVKPNLDSSKKKAESGKRGGSNKQTGSKSEANGKQIGSKKENEIEKEVEEEKENECYPPTPLPPTLNALPDHASPAGSVIADYCNRINPTASRSCLDELRGYAEEMGEAVCKRAFDIALDSKKTTWPYIRAILQDKHRRGVRCLADWDAMDESRPKTSGNATPQVRDGNANIFDQMRREEEWK